MPFAPRVRFPEGAEPFVPSNEYFNKCVEVEGSKRKRVLFPVAPPPKVSPQRKPLYSVSVPNGVNPSENEKLYSTRYGSKWRDPRKDHTAAAGTSTRGGHAVDLPVSSLHYATVRVLSCRSIELAEFGKHSSTDRTGTIRRDRSRLHCSSGRTGCRRRPCKADRADNSPMPYPY